VGISVVAHGGSYVVTAAVADLKGSKPAEVIALRLDRNGAAVDMPITIPGGGVSMASNGAVVYTTGMRGFVTGSRVIGAVLSVEANGLRTVRSDVLSTLPHRQIAPAATSDGVDFLAAWSDQTDDTQAVTFGRLSRSGAAMDSGGVDLMRVNGYVGAYATGHAGAAYVIVWHLYQQLWAQRISSTGLPIDPAPILIQNDLKGSVQVAVESLGANFFIVWATGTVYGAFLRADGSVSSPRQISPATPPPQNTAESHNDPDVAWDGKRFLVAWTTTQSPLFGFPPFSYRTEIRAVRVDAQGAPIDAASTVVAPDVQRPHIASSGRNFLVTVDGFRDLFVVIGRANGTSLAFDAPVRLFRYPFGVQSDVAWDGATYQVGWRSFFLSPGKTGLAVARVNENGTLNSTLAVETAPPDFPSAPSIAVNSLGETLLVISEMRDPGSARVRGYFARELEPLPPPPAAVRRVTAAYSPYFAYVSWEADSDRATGFVVEGKFKGSPGYFFVVFTGADVRTATIPNAATLELVRVIAYGLGGASEPSDSVPLQAPPRRRALARP
jgi:hypothetical protein